MRLLRRAAQRLFGFLGYRIVKRIPGSGPIVGYFVDSAGNWHPRFAKYKARIWPLNWQRMNQDLTKPTDKNLSDMAQTGRNAVTHMQQILAFHGLTVVGKDVLEIGASAGSAAYAMVELGANSVVGIDVPENFAIFEGPVSPESIRIKSERLTMLRQKIKDTFLAEGSKFRPQQVRFLDMDVRNLPSDASYDFIASYATLEHVFEPAKVFERIYSALKPGGISYHDYHPFFCESGGHFETLDFPWGHVRLSPQDFDRYMELYRPDELEVGRLRFYSSINRMTLSDLKCAIESSGLNIIEWIGETEHWHSVSPQIFRESKKNYPSLVLNDLLTPRVMVVLQKPKNATQKRDSVN